MLTNNQSGKDGHNVHYRNADGSQTRRISSEQPSPHRHKSEEVETPHDNPWLFTREEVEETPSRLQDIPPEIEARVLSKSAKFIQDSGRALRVPQLTISVAIKFFQRFYMLESMLAHKPPLVAAACLFLSCKVQETLKRLRDVIYWTVKMRTRDTEDYPDGMDVTDVSPSYNDEKNSILDKEREVLRVLNFDLNVDHPYRHLWELTRSYLGSSDDQRLVTQAAWNFLNDSFRTYMHARYDPREIATAAFFLSAKLHRIELPDGTKHDPKTGKRLLAWHELFRSDVYRVETICNMMLDLYDADDSTEAAELIANGPEIIKSLPQGGPPAKRQRVERSTAAQ